RAATVAAKRVPAIPARGLPASDASSAVAIRSTMAGSGPHRPSSPSTWASSRPNPTSTGSEVPATAGLNAVRRSKATSRSARSASSSASRKVASGASRCADPSGIPRRTPSALAAGSASRTLPFDQGLPPRITGPAGHEPEGRRRLAKSRRRCGRWRWRSRIVHPGHWDGGLLGRLGWPRGQQVFAAEAGVALSAVRVEDPERRPTTRWTGPIPGDHHLRSLADHVPAEPDPRSAGQLQPDAGRLADGAGETLPAGGVRRLEHEEADPGAPGQRRQSTEAIPESRLRGAIRARPGATGEVDDQQVHRPTGQQRAGDRETLVGIGRGQDDEPLRLDPPGYDLDRVERGREIQPGDDRAAGLRRRGEPQRERGPAARWIAPQGHPHAPRHAAGAEDGIELGEPRREDAIRIRLREALLERDRGERADDVTGEAGRRRAPARSKRRQGRAEVR